VRQQDPKLFWFVVVCFVIVAVLDLYSLGRLILGG
jgi:hypothetical protein